MTAAGLAMLLITFLVALALLLAFSKYKKTSTTILLIGFICFCWIGSGLLPQFLLGKLESPYQSLHPQWKANNAIILLGAGTIKNPNDQQVTPTVIAYSRIYEAARLYTSCKKTNNHCFILVSGGDALKTGIPEAIVYQDALVSLGIDPADIQVEAKSMNTYKNAEYTSKLIKQQTINEIILVTSAIHMKRSLLYFSQFGIHAEPAPADYLSACISVIPQSYNFLMMDFAVHEITGILRLYVYNFLGWNS